MKYVSNTLDKKSLSIFIVLSSSRNMFAAVLIKIHMPFHEARDLGCICYLGTRVQ